MADSATRPNGTSVTIEVFAQPRYRCPGCRRSWSSKTSARQHIERGCWKDPVNRSCKTCKHYDVHHAEPEVGLGWFHGCGLDDTEFGDSDRWNGDPRDDYVIDCTQWTAGYGESRNDG